MNAESPIESVNSPAEATSLWSKLFNIFASPGEVFDEIRGRTPRLAHWLVPALLSCLVGIVFSVTVFSQPDLLATMSQQQEAQLQKAVDAGKMTQDQMNQQLAAVRRFMTPTLMMAFGIGGSLVGTFVYLAFISLLVWVLADKILKGGVSFMKAFELAGLASMINVLGGLVTLWIVLIKGNVAAGPNAALFLASFDQTNVVHHFIGALNIFTLWYMAILALGVARTTGRSWLAAGSWVFGFWLVARAALAFVSAMFAKLQGG